MDCESFLDYVEKLEREEAGEQFRVAERRLLTAMLQDATRVLTKYPQSSRQWRADWYWMMESRNTSYPFSFESVCHRLEVDPDYFRLGVKMLIEKGRAVRRTWRPLKRML